ALWARQGFAAAAPNPVVVVDIRYRAPAECPSEEWFYGDVLGRVPSARRATPNERARRFDVTVVSEEGRHRASLEFLDAEERPVERELEAESCAEVVAGIAVVTAVAIDPRLADVERPAPEPEPVPAAKAAKAAEPSPVPSEPAAKRRSWGWSLGAHAGAVSDIAPVWSPSVEVFSQLVPNDVPLAARLTLGYADSGEFERDGAELRFWLFEGRAELCPFPLRLARGLRLLPCGGVELGAVHGEGRASPRVAEPAGTTGAWLAVGVTPAIELDVAGPFFLEAKGLVRFPLLSREYVLERPETVAHETPVLGLGAFLGAGARLTE
ncbi:MAG TPA: hypothetical protein VFZ53_18680, partial [Polyangiaceae bacterium]